MATEPAAELSVEASATSNAEPTSNPGSQSRDAVASGSQSNGDAAAHTVDKYINDIVDEVINSAEVSISGGSDTEASRPDGPKKDHDKGHIGTSSVKKPATFKPVSVNKTFLAAKGTSHNTTSKLGDKPVSNATSTTPHTSSSSSTVRPRLVAKSGSGLRDSSKSSSGNGRSAPDASAVWNKNRPAPPPEPKKFTDEELEKSGIHMAHRLQPDEAKGQSNWADIEDDDEDWAPETITWTDGTKTTIPHADEAAASLNLPRETLAKENRLVDKPRSPAPQATGSPVRPGVLASGKGLVLKGAPEKPTLVAKPPAPPTPVKSPWAPLPPIDKASPVVMDLPNHPSQRAFPPPAQVYGHKGVIPPPAKEIAADDFSRSPWRDGPGHANRELFNSQSGRYEPVPDRRGLSKTDAYPRQPAVLQRPSHSDNLGPAEPSAAFQTTHTSGNYGRRRGSSNVSGGSGGFLQRFGKPYDQPPPPALEVRRGSLTVGTDSPASPRDFSPSGLQGGSRHGGSPWQRRVSPAVSYATPQIPPASEISVPPAEPQSQPGPSNEDYDYQKKLMRERREMAMKRRMEEEAREEEAKQERLRKKLEALGPAPERKSARKEVAAKASPAATSTTEQNEPSSKPQPTSENKVVSPPEKSPRPNQALSDNKSEILPNGVRPPNQAPTRAPNSPEGLAAPDGKPTHLWQGRIPPPQPDRFWSAGQQASRNVWGPPNNDRSLGNGTFNSVAAAEAQIAQLPPHKQGNVSVPGPIGPPKTEAASSRLAPIGPPQQSARYTTPAQRGQPADAREAKRNAWANAVLENDSALFLERQQQAAQHEKELQARGLHHADVQGNISDQWRATRVDERGQRVIGETAKITHTAPGQPSQPSWGPSSESSSSHPSTMNVGGSNTSAPPVSHPSQSRFFPPVRDIRREEPLAPEIGRPQSPSPPPPDMDGHPAFDGDVTHPHVSLPRPKPVVKLPGPSSAPSNAASKPGSSLWATSAPFKDTGASHAHPPRSVDNGQGLSTSRPSSQARAGGTPNWQNLFDDLLRVDSSGRSALVPPTQPIPATVSLQDNFRLSASVDDGSFATKGMDEDCFEEQEMGSLPPVRIPTRTPDAAWQPAPPPPRLDRRLAVNATSADITPFGQDHSGPNKLFHVRFPGVERRTVAISSFQRNHSNPRRSRANARYGSSSHRGGNRNRDSSVSYSSEHGSTSGAPSHRGSRGVYRGRSDHGWTRNTSTPVQT